MINVIGAGPSGAYAGHLLAKKGLDVNIFEEHPNPGMPVECTGIVTSSISNSLRIPNDVISNKIERARIICDYYDKKSGKTREAFVETKFKDVNLILDRSKFDQFIVNKAIDSGAKIFSNHKFIGTNDNKELLFKVKNKQIISKKNDILIGADGPNSTVSKTFGMFANRKVFYGAQARIKLENDNKIEFYPNVGTIGWIVPENEEIVRIGILARNNVGATFKKFMMDKVDKKYKNLIIDYQGGMVPIYKNIRLQKGNVYLVGDAGLLVKATTGGGIIQGLISSEKVCEAITSNGKKDYSKLIRKSLRRDLWIHLKIRETLDKFSTKDYVELIDIFNKDSIKKIIEKFDRDFPSKFILKLMFMEPRLLKYLKFLI